MIKKYGQLDSGDMAGQIAREREGHKIYRYGKGIGEKFGQGSI